MPELPEVHTTVEGLKGVIVGKTIKGVWSDFHVGAKYQDGENIKNKKYLERFRKITIGVKIKSLERKGKNIIIHLSNGYSIVVHMKMTGHLVYGKYERQTPPQPLPLFRGGATGRGEIIKYIHLIFSLSGGQQLVLSDMRKFASVTISKTDEIHRHETVGKLGPDPIDPKFSAERLEEIIKSKKSMPIKSALLDQSALAGIGNIYSDEILWQTGVHPLSKASGVPKSKFGEIFKTMQRILRFSIKHGGDSKSDYRNAFGGKGEFQNFHKVYGKKGQRCPKVRCLGIIERTVVRGRSAHFCPKHQVKYK